METVIDGIIETELTDEGLAQQLGQPTRHRWIDLIRQVLTSGKAELAQAANREEAARAYIGLMRARQRLGATGQIEVRKRGLTIHVLPRTLAERAA